MRSTTFKGLMDSDIGRYSVFVLTESSGDYLLPWFLNKVYSVCGLAARDVHVGLEVIDRIFPKDMIGDLIDRADLCEMVEHRFQGSFEVCRDWDSFLGPSWGMGAPFRILDLQVSLDSFSEVSKGVLSGIKAHIDMVDRLPEMFPLGAAIVIRVPSLDGDHLDLGKKFSGFVRGLEGALSGCDRVLWVDGSVWAFDRRSVESYMFGVFRPAGVLERDFLRYCAGLVDSLVTLPGFIEEMSMFVGDVRVVSDDSVWKIDRDICAGMADVKRLFGDASSELMWVDAHRLGDVLAKRFLVPGYKGRLFRSIIKRGLKAEMEAYGADSDIKYEFWMRDRALLWLRMARARLVRLCGVYSLYSEGVLSLGLDQTVLSDQHVRDVCASVGVRTVTMSDLRLVSTFVAPKVEGGYVSPLSVLMALVGVFDEVIGVCTGYSSMAASGGESGGSVGMLGVFPRLSLGIESACGFLSVK